MKELQESDETLVGVAVEQGTDQDFSEKKLALQDMGYQGDSSCIDHLIFLSSPFSLAHSILLQVIGVETKLSQRIFW